MTFITGDGQDDHLLGESGDDWISGGSGDDAMLGDDGRIMTSRNGTAEPLYGVAATTQQAIEVKSLQLAATINVTGRLKHDVDLEPFDIGGNDVMYGGLGNDAMHGGAGQDLMSGAEAQAAFYRAGDDPDARLYGWQVPKSSALARRWRRSPATRSTSTPSTVRRRTSFTMATMSCSATRATTGLSAGRTPIGCTEAMAMTS
jgi:hypothetical protein